MSDEQERMNVAATGLLGTASSFLDEHFEACRPGYEAMLRSVGLRPGWRVLDAACGAGSFEPLMSRLVGPTGSIAAFDLAPDNVATVRARMAAGEFACPVEAQEASLTALPYADEEFDAVWCANALIYLDDGELSRALAEFVRVLRPSGLAAIKDPDGGLFRSSSRRATRPYFGASGRRRAGSPRPSEAAYEAGRCDAGLSGSASWTCGSAVR